MSSRGRRGSYWCHQCARTVRIYSQSSVTCPHCHGGFVEQVERGHYPFGYEQEDEEEMRAWHPIAVGGEPNPSAGDHPISQMMESLAAFLNSDEDENDNPQDAAPRRRRRRPRFGMDLGGFNPLMFLQGHMVGATAAAAGNMEIFYDSGTGTGPSRLPGNFGDYFLGPGLDELIQQLSENDPNRYGTPPASKTSVEAMPTISITQEHLGPDSVQCAVCKDEFEIGSEVKQMPCKHLYHPDCILPWLAQRNSCPVCRYEMPTDDPDYNHQSRESSHRGRVAGAALGHNSNFSLLDGGSRPPGGNGFGRGAVNNELNGSGYARPSAPSYQPSNTVSTSRGFQVSVPEPFRAFISMSQQAQAETGAGPANSGETVSSSPNDGNDVQGNNARIDDDGDTVMSEARQDRLD